MMKLIYAVLLIAVCYAGVEGQEGCFTKKFTACSQKLSSIASAPVPDSTAICKYRGQLSACLRESAEYCYKDRAYNFDEYENMYDDLCTPGTPLNLKFNKHLVCLADAVAKSTVCVQDVVDLFTNKEVTPEVIAQIGKISCERRKSIASCYAGSIEKQCGEEARDVIQTISDKSEAVNDLMCRDILGE